MPLRTGAGSLVQSCSRPSQHACMKREIAHPGPTLICFSTATPMHSCVRELGEHALIECPAHVRGARCRALPGKAACLVARSPRRRETQCKTDSNFGHESI